MLFQTDRLRVECADQVATLWLCESMVTRGLLLDLNEALQALEQCDAADVLVVRAGEPAHFLGGPHLDEYLSLTDAESRRRFAELGQQVLQRLENLSEVMPTIAFIEGKCVNAGLELVMACDFRLAVAQPQTRIGFDALGHGLLPCWGVTQRLPQLLGVRRAGEMLLENRLLPARAAKSLGLIDHAFGPRPAKTELNWFVADVQDHGRRGRCRPDWWTRCREYQLWYRPKSSAADPMSSSAIDALSVGWRNGSAEGYAAERSAFVENALHPASEARRQVARRRQRQEEAWRNAPLPARVGILGLGDPVVDLAVMALYGGASLVLHDPEPAKRLAIAGRLRTALRKAVIDGRFTLHEAEQKMKDVTISSEFSGADLVILTGSDRVQATTLIHLGQRLPPNVLLATTSPTLRFASLAAVLDRPDRAIGLRFAAAPGTGTPVELVASSYTAPATLGSLFRWLSLCGHVALAADLRATDAAAAA